MMDLFWTAAAVAPPMQNSSSIGESRLRGGRSFLSRKNLHPRRRFHPISARFQFETEAQRLTEYGHYLVEFLRREAAMVSRSISGEPSNKASFFPIDIVVSAFLGGVASYLLTSNSIIEKDGRMESPNSVGKNLNVLEEEEEEEENWLLVMNPTPFNRFVLMRCQSIEFEEEGDDVYEEGITKKLLVESRHFVKLRATDDVSDRSQNDDDDEEWGGFIPRLTSTFITNFQQNPSSNLNIRQVPRSSKGSARVPIPSSIRSFKQIPALINGTLSGYQRSYIHVGDGGVLAIDWPSHLDLPGENGLDTTFLLIAGTSEGSGNQNIQSFVQRSIRCGYFPIVMNPRGCGGSPLITPRMFTAGDSSDVHAVVDFVSRSRPWTTIMAIGWGYGANMLAKYLGEEASATPVTAAVCINNPFDLEESTKTSSDTRATDFDQRMTNGFVQILKENQMMFEGRKNKFDVRKGLSAKSVREFDKVISMVSNGFDDVHAFYEDSSSRSWIDNVRVPILCIQDDDAIGKSFSVPRHVFEKNAYATLILSLRKTWKLKWHTNQQELSRIQHDSLIIEWLAAVELAFLKGRHPLLEGIDVTYKPPKEWGLFSEQLFSSKNQGSLTSGRRTPIIEENSHDSMDEKISDWDLSLNEQNKLQELDQKDVFSPSKDNHHAENGVESAEDDPDVERGQLERAAESVMNALDITMPGSLSEKKKEEVLEAVGRGETIVTALQAACPEDVREKMTTAIAAAVQARGINLARAGFGKSIPAPNISESTVKEIQQKLSSVHDSLTNRVAEQSQPDALRENGNMVNRGVNDANANSEVAIKRPESKGSSEDIRDVNNLERTTATKFTFQNEIVANCQEDIPQSSSNVQQDLSENSSDAQINEQKTGDRASTFRSSIASNHQEDVPQSSSNVQDVQSEIPRSISSDGQVNGQETGNGADYNVGETKQMEPNQMEQMPGGESQEDARNIEEKKETENHQEGKNQSSPTFKPDSEDINGKPPGQSSEENSQQIPIQNSNSTSIDVRQALLAFTEVDDSTQMAVANVFEVIENVIDKLEKEQEKEEQDKQNQDESPESKSLSQVSRGGVKEQNTENESQKQSHIEVASSCNSQNEVRATRSITCDAHPNNKRLEDSQKFVNRRMVPGICNGSSNKGTDAMYAERNIMTGNSDNYTDSFMISNNYQSILLNSKIPRREIFISSKPTGMVPDDVALEYFEDEKIWKFIGNTFDLSLDEIQDKRNGNKRVEGEHETEHFGKLKPDDTDSTINSISGEVIEPTYIIMDDEKHVLGNRNCIHGPGYDGDDEHENLVSEELIEEHRDEEFSMRGSSHLKERIKDAIVDIVQLDLLRRFGDSEIKILGDGLSEDITMIGLAVAGATNPDVHSCQRENSLQNRVSQLQGTEKAPKLHVKRIMNAINNVYGGCTILPRLMPVGVLFGLVLAALSPLDILSTDDINEDQQTDNDQSSFEGDFLQKNNCEGKLVRANINNDEPVKPIKHSQKQHDDVINSNSSNEMASQDVHKANDQSSDTTSYQMMNLTAAAMGATTAFATEKGSNEESISTCNINGSHTTEILSKIDDAKTESNENKTNIVSAFAEKAMFVASPVVPVKEDGEVDHDRLVEVLAGLVQKGGMWRYIGKMALLWSGLKGAISLTDKLLGFLHISDRPLHQRLSGFVIMALLLWSPVLVPLLPTLLRQWTIQSYNGIASMAALVGLYGAVIILVAIWGRKIRGYTNPLGQYGIKLQPMLEQLQTLASGFVLGLLPIVSVHMLSIFCGFALFSWDSTICINGSKSLLLNIVSSLRMLKLVLKCLGTSLAVSFLKELIFRSWLQDEISVDLGFHKATFLSGLAFAVCHWFIPAIPGLWLLSVVLSGVKVKCNGSLVSAIGIHAGLIAGNQFMNQAGKLAYAIDVPVWIFGTRVGDPLTGLIGVSVLCVFVLSLYPWEYKLQSQPPKKTNESTST